jgi:hypothetical protein
MTPHPATADEPTEQAQAASVLAGGGYQGRFMINGRPGSDERFE